MHDRAAIEPSSDLKRQITQIALDHKLLSAYTAFVAVDAATRTAGSCGTAVPVAMSGPEGVRYDTTVMQ